MITDGFFEFEHVIGYFFNVLNQIVELFFSNWILLLILIIFLFSIVVDLFEILKGKK